MHLELWLEKIPLLDFKLTKVRITKSMPHLKILADTRVNHTGVLAVGNYSGSSLVVGIFTFVVNSLYGFNYAKINL